MTINISELVANTNTFGDWLFRTNEIVNAFANNAVTNVNPVSGNVVIQGNFEADDVYFTRIYGGAIGNTAPVEIASNTTFSANVAFTGNTVTLGVLSRYTATGANTSHFTLAANTATGRLRFVKGALLDESNEGNFTVTQFIQANTVYAVNISGGTQAAPNTVTITSEAEFSNTTNYSGTVTVNNDVFTINTLDYDLSSNTIDVTGTTGNFTFTSLTFTDSNIISSNSTMTFPVDSDLVIEGMTGPNNVRDSINTLKQEVISFAIALG